MTLAIGPANYAQQAYEWTCAAREYGMEATSFALPGPFNFRSHMDPDKAWLLDEVDDLLVDGFLPVLGGRLIGDELPFLTKQFHLGLIAHGSEMRNPDRHMDRIECSYYRNAPTEYLERLRWWSQYTAALVEQYPEVPIFVSTPDLLLDCPRATWLPLVVDVKEWTRPEWVKEDPPVVLHLPSRTTPPIKGTEVIAPVLAELVDANKIDLVDVDGMVPHSDVKHLVFEADIVVDQVLTGSYGVAACEAMAAGRVVVGHVADDVRSQIVDMVPIVEAPGSEFRDRMWDIVERWEDVSVVGEQGPGYVKKWHSGAKSVSVLRSFVEASNG